MEINFYWTQMWNKDFEMLLGLIAKFKGKDFCPNTVKRKMFQIQYYR